MTNQDSDSVGGGGADRVTATELFDALDPYEATVPRLVAERFRVSEARAEHLLQRLVAADRMVVARRGTDTPVWVRQGPV